MLIYNVVRGFIKSKLIRVHMLLIVLNRMTTKKINTIYGYMLVSSKVKGLFG